MKYSITTVCLPEMTMREQAAFAKRLGYDGLELRMRRVSGAQRAQPPGFWGRHANDVSPDNIKDKAADIRAVFAESGLKMVGLATDASCTDLEQVKLILEGAALLNAPFFRVGAADGYLGPGSYRRILGETIAGFQRVLDLTKGTAIKILLEIHGSTIHPSASLAYRIVSHFDPSRVGVIFDPQNMVVDGFETTPLAIDLLGPYLAHAHIGGHRPVPAGEDASGSLKWDWPGCGMNEGLYHYPTLLNELKNAGYRGFLSVEDFRSDITSEQKFSSAIQYLKSIAPA